jgi:hypothetical protein
MNYFNYQEVKANNYLPILQFIDQLIENKDFYSAINTLALIIKLAPHKDVSKIRPLYIKLCEIISKKYDLEISYDFHENNGTFYFYFNFLEYCDEDFLEKFPLQSDWIQNHDFSNLLEEYKKTQSLNLKEFSDWNIDIRELNSKNLVKKKFKYYKGDSHINFGIYEGKTFDQVFIINPYIIKFYFTNLSHFIPVLSFWFREDVLNTFKQDYWSLFEKYLIKLFVSTHQNQAIYTLNDFEKYLKMKKKEEAKLAEEAYMDAFENDASNLWNID